LISGYEYDIFISYRQKDNKYDGWVSEFVDNLRKELEATFKEDISVYFDFNPNDGLLETHDVDASLMEKLKCLIFIPIISRTYCDPKSFAWEHEFKVFVEQLLSIPSWMSPVWAEMDFRLASIKSLPCYKKLMIKYAVEE